jgi:hypothetical protein
MSEEDADTRTSEVITQRIPASLDMPLNAESILLLIMNESSTPPQLKRKNFLDFIEHPLTLTALFALGGPLWK